MSEIRPEAPPSDQAERPKPKDASRLQAIAERLGARGEQVMSPEEYQELVAQLDAADGETVAAAQSEVAAFTSETGKLSEMLSKEGLPSQHDVKATAIAAELAALLNGETLQQELSDTSEYGIEATESRGEKSPGLAERLKSVLSESLKKFLLLDRPVQSKENKLRHHTTLGSAIKIAKVLATESLHVLFSLHAAIADLGRTALHLTQKGADRRGIERAFDSQSSEEESPTEAKYHELKKALNERIASSSLDDKQKFNLMLELERMLRDQEQAGADFDLKSTQEQFLPVIARAVETRRQLSDVLQEHVVIFTELLALSAVGSSQSLHHGIEVAAFAAHVVMAVAKGAKEIKHVISEYLEERKDVGPKLEPNKR